MISHVPETLEEEEENEKDKLQDFYNPFGLNLVFTFKLSSS